MTEQTNSWKLKLNFKDGLPNLAESVNGTYYKKHLMFEAVKFYADSELLINDVVEIKSFDSYGELLGCVILKASDFQNDNSNKYSF